MECILHIETSGRMSSVAVTCAGEVVFERISDDGSATASVAPSYVADALSEIDARGLTLAAVAVSKGPGSYTGLRVGVSLAKGLCLSRGVKLIAVSTLQLLCVPVLLFDDDLAENSLICPMIDARRMEVYSALYDRSLRVVRQVAPEVVAESTYDEYLLQGPVVFVGDGADKCVSLLKHPNARVVPGVKPLAKNMGPLAEKLFALQQTEDVAYFEPFYLKDFVATKPKKLV